MIPGLRRRLPLLRCCGVAPPAPASVAPAGPSDTSAAAGAEAAAAVGLCVCFCFFALSSSSVGIGGSPSILIFCRTDLALALALALALPSRIALLLSPSGDVGGLVATTCDSLASINPTKLSRSGEVGGVRNGAGSASLVSSASAGGSAGCGELSSTPSAMEASGEAPPPAAAPAAAAPDAAAVGAQLCGGELLAAACSAAQSRFCTRTSSGWVHVDVPLRLSCQYLRAGSVSESSQPPTVHSIRTDTTRGGPVAGSAAGMVAE
jgi:hypothetical protein